MLWGSADILRRQVALVFPICPLHPDTQYCLPVIAISDSQAKLATKVRLAGVIHHGVDISEFPIGGGKGGYAIFLGRMSPDKGVHIAIDAAKAAGIPLLIAAKCREKSEIEYFTEQVEPRLGLFCL